MAARSNSLQGPLQVNRQEIDTGVISPIIDSHIHQKSNTTKDRIESQNEGLVESRDEV